MNTPEMLWFALVRTTIWLTASAIMIQILIWTVRPVSPRTYRIAWACVLISGIAFGRVPIDIPSTSEPVGAVVASPADWAPPPRTNSLPLPTEPMPVSAPPAFASKSPAAVQNRIENEISAIPATVLVPAFHFPWHQTALVVWVLGVAVMLSVGVLRYVRFASGIARFERAPNESERERDDEWQREWHLVLDQGNSNRRIPLVVSESGGPALCLALSGYRVIVPRPLWESLSAAKRISILRHELAHYERGDLYNSLFALLIVAMHWFNPCAWWARRQFDAAGEWACDDAAARTCNEIEFAKTLMQLAGIRSPAIPLTDAVASGPLYARIRRLLTASSAADARWKRNVIAVVAVAIVGVASIRVSRVAEATSPPPSAPKTGSSQVDPFGDPLPEGAVMRLGTMRLRQYGVERTAFLPDGQTIASMAFTGTFRLWDRKTGRLLQSFQDSVGDYTSGRQFALSPDGAKLVSVGRFFENKVAKLGNGNKSRRRRPLVENGYVCFWDTRNGKRIWSRMVPGREDFDTVAFSPDGTIIAAGRAPFTLYDVASGKELRRCGDDGIQSPPLPLGVLSHRGNSVIVFSPDGRTLITFEGKPGLSPDRSRPGLIRVWDVQTGNPSGSISISGDLEIESLFTSLDGQQIIAGGYRNVPAAKFPRPIVTRNALVPEICYWDLQTGRLARTYRFEDTTFGTGAISLSKDQKIIAWNVGGSVCIWDAVAGKPLRQFPLAFVGTASLSPDGTVVAVGHVNELIEWDTTTGKRLPVDIGDVTTSQAAAKFSPDGQTIYTGASDGRLTAWDATTGAIRFQKTHGPLSSISSLDVSVDGQWVATCGTKEKLPKGGNLYAAVLWDARTGEPVRDYYDHDQPLFAQGVAVSPGSRFLALAGKRVGNEVVTQIWDVKSGNKIAEIRPAEEEMGPRSMRFSPDSRSLITLNANSYIRRWNVMTGRLEQEFFAAKSPANPERMHWTNGAAIALDGRTAVSSERSAIYTWNLDSGQLVSEIRMPNAGKERWFNELAISKDARLLAAVEVVGTIGASGAMNQITGSIIRIYDRATGRELQNIETKDVRAAGLDFSPDANRLAAVMNDGTALVWDLSPAQRRLHQ